MRTVLVLGVFFFLIMMGLDFYVIKKMNQPVPTIDNHKIVDSLSRAPGVKSYFTEWKFSHLEKFNKALIDDNHWTIFTDKSPGAQFCTSHIKINYSDNEKKENEVAFFKRKIFTKSYIDVIFPSYLFSRFHNREELKIEIIASNPLELQKRIYPQVAYNGLMEAFAK